MHIAVTEATGSTHLRVWVRKSLSFGGFQLTDFFYELWSH